MRKMMTKEVTSTTVKVAVIDMVDGVPTARVLDDLVMLGNVDKEKAQKLVTKTHGAGVQVMSVEADTKTYELEVAEFLKIARLKETKEEVTTQDQEDEDELL